MSSDSRLNVLVAGGGVAGLEALLALHDLAGEMEREDTPEGAHIRARVPVGVAARFERFSVNGSASEDE